MPRVGADVSAVRSVARVADELTQRVLPDVVEASASVSPSDLRPRHGKVDLAPLVAVTPRVVRADRRLGGQLQTVQAIDTTRLDSRVAGPVEQLESRLSDAAAVLDPLSRAVRLLPPMLGQDGTRRYLLMFQNNAEARSSGGIPGSFAVVTARGGKVSIDRQGDAGTIGRFSTPPLRLTAAEKDLFGTNLGTFAQDVTFTPDFPRSAQIVRAMWQQRFGGRIDGVASVDPVALSHVLGGTGPVQVPGGKLTAGNAVQTLLSSVYARIPDPLAQNVYFRAVAGNVFEAVASGQGDPRAVVRELATSVSERRLLLWSSRSAEEDLISPTRLGGLVTADTAAPQVGVFLNDAGGSKLDYYLDASTDVSATGCRAGRQELTVTLHLRSRVPRGAAGLPTYVVNHRAGQPKGNILLTTLAYAPPGGSVRSVSVGGAPVKLARHRIGGRDVVLQPVSISPQGVGTITWRMLTDVDQSGPVDLRVTPGVHSDGVGTVGPPAC